jgi:hypothetical protein
VAEARDDAERADTERARTEAIAHEQALPCSQIPLASLTSTSTNWRAGRSHRRSRRRVT